MTFRFTVKQNPLSVAFDSDTIEEGIQVLMGGKADLHRIFSEFAGEIGEADDSDENGEGVKKRTRRTKAQIAADKAAESTAPVASVDVPLAPLPVANAPAPLAVPGSAAGSEGIGIPAFLDRTGTAAAPPPAPPAPVAPAPVAEVRLCDKVIEELKRRAMHSPDSGQSLADWLVKVGVVPALGSTFDEAVTILMFTKDEQLKPVAVALGVA